MTIPWFCVQDESLVLGKDTGTSNLEAVMKRVTSEPAMMKHLTLNQVARTTVVATVVARLAVTLTTRRSQTNQV